jgi:toxin ParE1/3/4
VKLRVYKSRKFKRDALRTFVYIGERNLTAAEGFLRAVDSDLRKLSEFPGMGGLRQFPDPRLADVRSWPVSGYRDYLIFYRPTSARLEALRLIHGARDIEREMTR